jgi:hypothetical protein
MLRFMIVDVIRLAWDFRAWRGLHVTVGRFFDVVRHISSMLSAGFVVESGSSADIASVGNIAGKLFDDVESVDGSVTAISEDCPSCVYVMSFVWNEVM